MVTPGRYLVGTMYRFYFREGEQQQGLQADIRVSVGPHAQIAAGSAQWSTATLHPSVSARSTTLHNTSGLNLPQALFYRAATLLMTVIVIAQLSECHRKIVLSSAFTAPPTTTTEVQLSWQLSLGFRFRLLAAAGAQCGWAVALTLLVIV